MCEENGSSRKLSNYTLLSTIQEHFVTKLPYKQRFIHDLPYNFETPSLSQVQSNGTIKTFTAKNIVMDNEIEDIIKIFSQPHTLEHIIYSQLDSNKEEFYKVFPQSNLVDTKFQLTASQMQDYLMGQLICAVSNHKFDDCSKKDMKELISVLKKKGVDFNHRMPLPPLVFYCAKNSAQFLISLIEDGVCDRNTKDINGHTL